MLIATTATVGLLLVGVLALSMTPDRLGSPDEPAAATGDVVVSPGADPVGAGPGGAPQSAADSILRVVSSFLTSTSAPETVNTPAGPLALPLATTTTAAPIATQETTSPSSVTALPSGTSAPPAATAQDIEPSPSSTAAAAASLAAFTTQVDDPVEFDAGSSDDSDFAFPGGNELLPPIPLGPTTSSSTVVSQSTTSTSTSSTSTSSTSSSTTTSSTSSTVPDSSLPIPPKQLNNG